MEIYFALIINLKLNQKNHEKLTKNMTAPCECDHSYTRASTGYC